METPRRLRRHLTGNQWMVAFDLQDGYYALEIAPEHQQYFTIEVDQQAYRPSVPAQADDQTAEQQRGMLLLHYLDDYLILGDTPEQVAAHLRYALSLLSRLGIAVNEKKSTLTPVQQIKHLGIGVDTKRNVFYVTPDRLKNLQAQAKSLSMMAAQNRRWVPARRLASFIGLAQFVYLAVPPARFYLRSLHDSLSRRASWSARVKLSHQALSDLRFWIQMPIKWNGRTVRVPVADALLHTDASKSGWGGVLNSKVPATGFWKAHQRQEHITALELRAVRLSVLSFIKELKGRRVLHFCDNMAVVHILTNITARTPSMMAELRKLFWVLDVNDISLRTRHIRSAANVWADQLSRRWDNGDWRLSRAEFLELDRRYGPHNYDRFATTLNRQVQRFDAAFHMPEVSAIDTLTQDWSQHNNYANPPWDLMPQVAQKINESQHLRMTLIVPYWNSHLAFRSRSAPARSPSFRRVARATALSDAADARLGQTTEPLPLPAPPRRTRKAKVKYTLKESAPQGPWAAAVHTRIGIDYGDTAQTADIQQLVTGSLAERSIESYGGKFDKFVSFCVQHHLSPLPVPLKP
ncbi:reverse transcriptase domain-containing protein [Pseudoscourfieldia marina]